MSRNVLLVYFYRVLNTVKYLDKELEPISWLSITGSVLIAVRQYIRRSVQSFCGFLMKTNMINRDDKSASIVFPLQIALHQIFSSILPLSLMMVKWPWIRSYQFLISILCGRSVLISMSITKLMPTEIILSTSIL